MAIYGGPDIVTDGLVLHLDAANSKSYPGSGTSWFDLSGNNNNGTLTNGPIFSSANRGSIVFDGINDYVNLGTTNLSSTLSSLTISIFTKILKINAKQALVSCYQGSPQAGYGLELLSDNTANIFGFTNQTTADGVSSTRTLSLNEIIYITFIFTNNTFFLYLNGLLNNSKLSNFSTIFKNSNIYISEDPSSNVIPFGGNIYNLQIYNRSLSANEVLQNYNALKGRYGL